MKQVIAEVALADLAVAGPARVGPKVKVRSIQLGLTVGAQSKLCTPSGHILFTGRSIPQARVIFITTTQFLGFMAISSVETGILAQRQLVQ